MIFDELKVMSGLLENGSSPSEVDSLDLDEVSYSVISLKNHYPLHCKQCFLIAYFIFPEEISVM